MTLPISSLYEGVSRVNKPDNDSLLEAGTTSLMKMEVVLLTGRCCTTPVLKALQPSWFPAPAHPGQPLASTLIQDEHQGRPLADCYPQPQVFLIRNQILIMIHNKQYRWEVTSSFPFGESPQVNEVGWRSAQLTSQIQFGFLETHGDPLSHPNAFQASETSCFAVPSH